MAFGEFGLQIKVTEGTDDGPAVPNAAATIAGGASGDASGNIVIDTVYVSVTAPGFASYVNQPYVRPSLQGPITVSLQRL